MIVYSNQINRIRSGTNDKAASELQTFSMDHGDYVPYNSGFGQQGLPYFLECRLILVLLLICQQKDIGLHKN